MQVTDTDLYLLCHWGNIENVESLKSNFLDEMEKKTNKIEKGKKNEVERKQKNIPPASESTYVNSPFAKDFVSFDE